MAVTITRAGSIRVLVDLREIAAETAFATGDPLRKLIDYSEQFTDGTTDDKFDRIYGGTLSLAGSAQTIDLSGSLTMTHGSAFSPVEIGLIVVRNNSTTLAHVCKVGGAAANQAYAGLFDNASDILIVPPSGINAWYSPLDGAGLVVANGTADQLKFDPGAYTFTVDFLLAGRSA